MMPLLPLRPLIGAGLALSLLAALFFAYRFIYTSAVDATNLAHMRQVQELRADYASRLAALKSRFESEIVQSQTENDRLAKAYEEFENATRAITAPAGCGASADSLRALEAIR